MAERSQGQETPRLIVRGADDALYVIPEDRLAEFRVPDEQARELEAQLPPSRPPARASRPLGGAPRLPRAPRIGPAFGPGPRFRPGPVLGGPRRLPPRRPVVFWQG